LPEAMLGLRERKKLKTRAALQKEAMRLFLKKGFEATTIEEIAESVEVSPSTFFNYFSSKEDLVLQDDLDPVMIAAFNEQPAELSPIAALRAAMKSMFSGLTKEQEAMMQQRMALVQRDPDVRAAMLNQFAGMVDQVAEVLAARVGRSATDFAVRNLAGALIGVLMSALLAAASDPNANLIQLADGAIAHLEAGLPLGDVEVEPIRRANRKAIPSSDSLLGDDEAD
jgi:AcrR family transcriptional regulator